MRFTQFRHRQLGATLLVFLFLVAAGLTATWSLSQEKEKKDPFPELIATTSETHLLLFGFVDNVFSEEMISGLKSGLPIRFNFFVELLPKMGEEPVAQQEFSHTLSYDTLKDSYQVLLGEANAKVLLVKNLERAHQLMSEINGLQVVELASLVENSSYRLRIRAELFEKTMPMGFHRLLPFFSHWNTETDWQILEFNY